ncbi:TPA: hypothetical protein SUZ15_002055, partial [Streptococcus equi subsp. equi]|nr:hypothetical protein [Streptococcus equi subsp. equi]HEK9565345.1 hypothetical protein [Streptococcus equi subsp. equi]
KVEQSVFLVINDIIDNNTVFPDVNARNSLKKIAISTLGDRTFSTPYDFISEHIYNNADLNSVQDDEMLVKNIEILKNYALQNNFENFDYSLFIKNLNKIHRHYKLALIQKNFILRTTTEVEERAHDLKDKTKAIEQKMFKFDEIKSSIYTDFIAILGVFSAFVFVMFGGIDVARAIFDIGSDLQTLDLSRMITIASLMLIGILTLMYSLLLWIARITGKNFGNCYSSKCDNGCQHKWRHFLMRHSFYFSLMGLLIVVILFSHYVFK